MPKHYHQTTYFLLNFEVAVRPAVETAPESTGPKIMIGVRERKYDQLYSITVC
jgi:hypothetical protein